jgi:transcriptional regulator with GAF, ATPase, and Fis domain
MKPCLYCGNPLIPRPTASRKERERQKTCSHACDRAYRVAQKQARMAYVERWIALKGRKWCAKKLGISANTVSEYLTELGMRAYENDAWLNVSALATLTGDTWSNVVHHAKKDGVLVKRPHCTQVPKTWAEEYMERQRQRDENTRALQAGYMNVTQAARYLGLDRRRVGNALSGKGYLAPYFRGVRVLHGRGRQRLMNPHDIEAIRREWERRAA